MMRILERKSCLCSRGMLWDWIKVDPGFRPLFTS